MRDDDVKPRSGARAKPRRAIQVRQARTLLAAHVGWLGGYPDPARPARGGSIAWRGTDVAKVDRAALAATTRALHELHRDFAAVLPTIVGDVAAWRAGVDAAMIALKAAVHDRAAPPALWPSYPGAVVAAATALAEGHAALAPLLHALSWTRIGDARAALADLRWLAAHAGAVAAIVATPDGVARALAVRRVVALDGDARAAPLLALLADPTLAEVIPSAGDHVQRAIGWLGSGNEQPTARPAALGTAIRDLADWTATLAPPARRNVLRALTIIDLPGLLDRWRAYWGQIDRCVAAGARARSNKRGCRHAELGAAVAELRRLLHDAPQPVVPRDLDRVMRTVSTHATGEDLDLAASLPRAAGLPHPLTALANLIEDPDDAPVITAGRRALLADYLAARRDEPLVAWLEPVAGLLAGERGLWPMDALLPRAADWRRLRDALIAAMRAGLDVHRHELLGLVAIVAASTSADDAAARLAALGRARPPDPHHALRIATILSDEPDLPIAARPDRFAPLVRVQRDARAVVDDEVVDDEVDDDAIVELVAETAPAGRAVLRALLSGERARRLRDAAATRCAARALRGRPPPRLDGPAVGQVPTWARACPETLHPALALADAAGLAETARKKVDALFGDPARIAVELAAIDARLATVSDAVRHRLTIRRDNLAARLATPPVPSLTRLKRLATELSAAALLAWFDAWCARLDAHIAAALPRALGVDVAAVPWLLAPRHRALVRGIAALDGADRALALRVLAARAGAPPWDLREAAPNRVFLARMAARDITMRPWIDGRGARLDGTMVLSLEDDPLEVLHMGRHFGTCLSPGSENFYSAVVNAADINKRVVYGRVDGKVVGRCLLAITDDGALVTFAPYAHTPDFEPALRRFVAALATEMGTRLVPGGTVSPLLHTRWYDDGARDLTGRFEFLHHGSAFRKTLATIQLDALIDELTARFAPLPLGGYVLGLFLHLTELDARPELALPLAPLVAAAEDLPLAMRLRAASLLRQLQRPDLVDPRLAEHVERALRQVWRQHRWVNAAIIMELAELAPARALALLRVTRGAGVREARMQQEDGLRILAAAVAFARLRRPRQAIEQYRRALRLGHGHDHDAHCRARIAALEADLRARPGRGTIAR